MTSLTKDYQKKLEEDQLTNPAVLVKDFYNFMWEVRNDTPVKLKKVAFSDMSESDKRTMTYAASKILQRYFVITKEMVKNEH